MKKILYIVLLLSLFIAGCKEDEKLIYHGTGRIGKRRQKSTCRLLIFICLGKRYEST